LDEISINNHSNSYKNFFHFIYFEALLCFIKCSQIICGVGHKQKPVNSKNSIPQSLDTTLVAFGIVDQPTHDDIHNQIQLASESLLASIISYENKLSPNERGGTGAQTDLIGVDYILSELDGRVVAVAVGVHSYHCAMSSDAYEFMYPETKGDAHGTFIQTIVERSQRHIMHGKKVLVIGGAAAFGKMFIWPAAKDYGIEVRML